MTWGPTYAERNSVPVPPPMTHTERLRREWDAEFGRDAIPEEETPDDR